MFSRFQKGVQDGVTLISVLEPHSLQVSVKTFLCRAQGFPRNGGVIVNALGQHGVKTE
jgi:hypothetical protein